jgi:histone deacetylase complex regulatory component SIN3
VEDALLYLDQVKVEFGDRPHIYNEFLDIMKTFKTQQIDTPGVIRRVSNLFQGNKRLVLGFNTFLPEGYKIELPLDGDGPPVAVFRAPGENGVTHIISGPGAPPVPAPAAASSAESQPSQQQSQHQQPPPAPSAAARPAGPPHVASQPPHRAGQPMAQPPNAHAPGQRGSGHLRPPGAEKSVASSGVAAAGYASHAQQGVMHLPQGPRGEPRGQVGQLPPMMGAAENAARARLEQQARVAAGPPIPGRGPHAAPMERGSHAPPMAAGRTGLPGLGQSQQPGIESKVPPRQAPGNQNLGPVRHAGLNHQSHLRMHNAEAPSQQPPAAAAPQQPLEFDHAINYVTTIKKRFANEPETYKKFLEILHTYQKEQRGIKEVLEEVSTLFSEHPDLLKEFTYFLPDNVQAEAKAQLEIVAKEAEIRNEAKRQAAARSAALEQAQVIQRQQPSVLPPPQPQPPIVTSQPISAVIPQPREAPPPLPPLPPPPPPPAPAAVPIPFGATQGRSVDREREIGHSVVYGAISFAPARPPRKKALTVTQSAAKNGRPTVIPPLPKQPTTAETSFFDRAKRHLNRRELAPDKPTGSRVRHTPYAEFLKCLHLYAAGVLNKDELILLLRGLFMQGHAPKSGVNAGGGASNPSIATDAHELLKEFEEVRHMM